ncbi:MAG: hypothetical protein RSD95_07770 [Clostridia bacterium]
MNGFRIDEGADGVFTLRISGKYVCRCFSYDDAMNAYEDYLLVEEAKKQGGKKK